jgi:hypothetical protein
VFNATRTKSSAFLDRSPPQSAFRACERRLRRDELGLRVGHRLLRMLLSDTREFHLMLDAGKSLAIMVADQGHDVDLLQRASFAHRGTGPAPTKPFRLEAPTIAGAKERVRQDRTLTGVSLRRDEVRSPYNPGANR